MGKVIVEVCLISARGLRRGPSLLKHQWYAVGWFDPDNKYCTTIDVSRTDNPVWRTKFSASLDDPTAAALHVQVYSREPIFLREKLHGTATVVLKEFLAKYSDKQRSPPLRSSAEEEVGSFQLRKKGSNKPHGFVDVSIRISAEREELLGSFTGDVGGIVLNTTTKNKDNPETKSSAEAGEIHLSGQPETPLDDPVNHRNNQSNTFPVPQYYHHPRPPMQYPPGNMNPPMPRPGYPPPQAPPSHAGYVPTFLPRSENFIDMPSSSSSGRPAAGPGYVRPGPAFAAGVGAGALAAGVGAGALAAGAVIFGDDFMSGFHMPSTLPHASLTISADPPF